MDAAAAASHQFHHFLIAADAMFGEKAHGGGRPFQILNVLAGDDDTRAVFSPQSVAGSAYLVIAALVGMVALVVGEAGRIKNQMVVNMPLINMGGVSTNSYLPPNISFATRFPISWASSANSHCNGFPSHIQLLRSPCFALEESTVFGGKTA